MKIARMVKQQRPIMKNSMKQGILLIDAGQAAAKLRVRDAGLVEVKVDVR
jgi:hypothetical protein